MGLLFIGLCTLALLVLAAWGITLRGMTRHIQASHPDIFADLRAHSRKGGERLAVTSVLSSRLAAKEPLPEQLMQDAYIATAVTREAMLRNMLWPLVLIAAAVFIWG